MQANPCRLGGPQAQSERTLLQSKAHEEPYWGFVGWGNRLI